MITRSRQAARQAEMPTVGKRLSDFCSADTCLTCVSWINFDSHTRSLFRFRAQLIDKASPSGIVDTLGESRSRQSFGIQILYGDQAVLVDQSPAKFVMKICALVADMRVDALKQKHCLASAIRSLPPTCYAPLRDSQGTFPVLVVTRIFNRFSSAQGSEMRQSNVYADGVWVERQRFRLNLTSEDREPSSGLSLDREGLDLSFNRTAQFDSDVADFRDAKFAIRKRVADLPERHRVVAPRGSKSWVSSLLSSLDTAKERFECAVNASNSLVQSGGAYRRNVISYLPNPRHLVNLIKPGDGFALHPPRVASFLKRRVIQLGTNRKLLIQRFCLSFSGINSAFERLKLGAIIT